MAHGRKVSRVGAQAGRSARQRGNLDYPTSTKPYKKKKGKKLASRMSKSGKPYGR